MLIYNSDQKVSTLDWIVFEDNEIELHRKSRIEHLIGKSCFVYTRKRGHVILTKYIGNGLFRNPDNEGTYDPINWYLYTIKAVALDPFDLQNSPPC